MGSVSFLGSYLDLANVGKVRLVDRKSKKSGSRPERAPSSQNNNSKSCIVQRRSPVSSQALKAHRLVGARKVGLGQVHAPRGHAFKVGLQFLDLGI